MPSSPAPGTNGAPNRPDAPSDFVSTRTVADMTAPSPIPDRGADDRRQAPTGRILDGIRGPNQGPCGAGPAAGAALKAGPDLECRRFPSAARGDQPSWLLGRLRRLQRLNVERATGGPGLAPQLCAGSATVSNPEGLAGRLLGTETAVVRVEGTREVEAFGPPGASGWFPLEPSMEIATLRDRLEPVPSAEFAESRPWSGNLPPLSRKELVSCHHASCPDQSLPGRDFANDKSTS